MGRGLARPSSGKAGEGEAREDPAGRPLPPREERRCERPQLLHILRRRRPLPAATARASARASYLPRARAVFSPELAPSSSSRGGSSSSVCGWFWLVFSWLASEASDWLATRLRLEPHLHTRRMGGEKKKRR